MTLSKFLRCVSTNLALVLATMVGNALGQDGISLRTPVGSAATAMEAGMNPEATVLRDNLIAFPLQLMALELQGIRYRFGGNSPERGLDCSGLVRLVWARLGLPSLPRTSAEMASIGEHVGINDLKPGDLVFFNTRDKRNSHVGIYTGMGRFIHASSVQRKVTENSIDEDYYKARFNGARRLATMLSERSSTGLVVMESRVSDAPTTNAYIATP